MKWRRIDLHGATGLPSDRHGPRLEGLGPGLVVVVGGNGTGKSTLASALRAALWRETEVAARRAIDLSAVAIRQSGEEARVTVRAGQANWQPGDFELPDRALAGCLVLHGAELRGAEDAPESGLVRRVRLALARGVDLDRAWRSTQLGPRHGRTQAEALQTARAARRSVETRLRRVADDEAALPGQRAERTRRAAALRRSQQLRRAAEELGRLAQEVRTRVAHEAELGELTAPGEDGAALWLPESARPRAASQVQQLVDRARRLAGAEQALQSAAEELRREEAVAAAAAARLPRILAGTSDAADLDQLATWLEDRARLLADAASIEKEVRRAETVRDAAPETSIEDLRAAREALLGWSVAVSDRAYAGLRPDWAFVPTIGCVLAAILLGVLLDPRYVVLAAGGVVGFAILLSVGAQRRGVVRRAWCRSRFERVGLAPPTAWRREDVATRAAELDVAVAASVAAARATAELEGVLRERRQSSEAALATLHRTGSELFGSSSLGGAFAWDHALLLRRTVASDEAQGRVARSRAGVAARRDAVLGSREELAEIVAAWGVDSVPVEAEDWQSLANRLVALRAELERLATTVAAAASREREQRALVTLRLTEADFEAELPDWSEALSAERLLDLRADVLDQAAESDRSAEGLAEIDRAIGAAEQRVRDATAADDLSERLATEDEARDGLREARDVALRRTARAFLCERLERSLQREEMPQTWRRAASWLGRFTRRKFDLELAWVGSAGDASGRSFGVRVVETASGTRHAPDELSTGTRAQLLLALRLALATSAESGEPWPMVLDEVLPSTDLARAREIARALAEISRDRQVLYLTCHEREIALLREACQELAAEDAEGPPTPTVHRLEATAPLPVTVLPAPPPALPSDEPPQPPDPRDVPAALQLVHLLHDDLPAAQRLAALGITTVGAWQAHGKPYGEPSRVEDPDRLDRRIVVWSALCAVWQRTAGRRARPADFASLGGVHAATAIERLREHAGDAHAVLAELDDEAERRRRYPRLRSQRLADLRAQLGAAGCLGDGRDLRGDELLAAVCAAEAVALRLRSGELASEEVAELLRRLAAATSSAEGAAEAAPGLSRRR